MILVFDDLLKVYTAFNLYNMSKYIQAGGWSSTQFVIVGSQFHAVWRMTKFVKVDYCVLMKIF